MAKKWQDPLDKLLEGDEKALSVKDYLEKKSQAPTHENTILEIDGREIIRWEHKDRPENELGDIEELSETFKAIGQQQPCILRPSKNHHGKYELIVGERRWRAAEHANIKLKAIVRELDDKAAALIQAVENEKRADISDFAKGMSYADKIEKGLLTQKDLIEILKVRKEQVTRLLSFNKIPKPLLEAIGDLRKVSSRTAYDLVRLSKKGEEYIDILIELAPQIREGKCGHHTINAAIKKKTTTNTNKNIFNKQIFHDGQHLFSWRLDNNNIPSIHFPKNIVSAIQADTKRIENLTQEIKKCITKELDEIKN